MNRAFRTVDVFSSTPLKGNPVAIVLDAEGLETADMQAIARWTNLSETTFLLPPTEPSASYRLRIFTPRSELAFAGHPTLGSAFAALEAGRVTAKEGQLIQECGAGLINIDVTAEALFLEMPEAQVKPLETDIISEIEAILDARVATGVAPATVDVGITWIVAPLADEKSLLGLKPNLIRLARLSDALEAVGLTVFCDRATADGPHIEVRTFAPSCGVEEDPVCGSGNGCVAAYRKANGLPPSQKAGYIAAQGQCVGRNGRVFIRYDTEGKIHVGGACVTTVSGTISC